MHRDPGHVVQAELAAAAHYARTIGAHVRRVAARGAEIVLHGMDPGTYPTGYPGPDIRYLAIPHMHTLQFLEHAVRAERDGYDGFRLSTMPQPGLRNCAASWIPGGRLCGFAAMHTACYLGGPTVLV